MTIKKIIGAINTRVLVIKVHCEYSELFNCNKKFSKLNMSITFKPDDWWLYIISK